MEQKIEMGKLERLNDKLTDLINSAKRLQEIVRIEKYLTTKNVKNAPRFFMSKPKQAEFEALSSLLLIDAHIIDATIKSNGAEANEDSDLKAKL